MTGPEPFLEVSPDDPGCDAVFAAMDEYADGVLRGDDRSVTHSRLLVHLKLCRACREDFEGLLAALIRAVAPSRK